MSVPALVEAKRALRQAMRERRSGLRLGGGEAAASSIRDRIRALLDAVQLHPGPLAAFWPMDDEIDVEPTLKVLDDAGWDCALPVVTGRAQALLFRRWRWGDRLEPAPFGTSVPGATAAIVIPRVLLVPLLAFDRRGFRLGHGGGYYDRTLAALRRSAAVLAIGVAYAGQEIDAVPHDAHDQRLDLIATERELIRPVDA